MTQPNTAPANSAAPVPETPAPKAPENQPAAPPATPPAAPPASTAATPPPAAPPPATEADPTPASAPKDAAEIVRLCTRCGCPDKAAEYLENRVPLDRVRAALLEQQIAARPVSNQVGNPEPGGKKPEAPTDKFGEEYDDAREVHAKFGVTREEYVRSRCLDEGLEPPAKSK